MKKYNDTGCRINRIETTNATLSNRGGLSFILRYIEKVGLFTLIQKTVTNIHCNAKSKPIPCIIRQILAFFIDGSIKAISGFDILRQDDGYAATLEVEKHNLLSSHAVKRFFGKFTFMKCSVLRTVLNTLFIWRLQVVKPSVIVIDVDTVVLDNDDAQCREGVSPTYKKVKGFQNLQLTWQGIVIDAMFRRGSAHSNHGNDVKNSVKRVVDLIRSDYRSDVPIVITMDSGFLDEKNLHYFDSILNIFYVCQGKLYDTIKEFVGGCNTDCFAEFGSGKAQWEYVEFGSKLKSWNDLGFVRTIFTRLLSDEKGQTIMDFARPDSVIYTNIDYKTEHCHSLKAKGCEKLLTVQSIISLAHGRGKSELANRSLKEFMTSEHLPFKNFGMNAAYYYLMVIGHVMAESYKRDVLRNDIAGISPQSYPSTVRRRVIDFAASIVRTGNCVILRVTKALCSTLNVKDIWRRCNGEGITPIAIQC